MYLGIDLGTQSIKGVILDEKGILKYEYDCNYSKDLNLQPYIKTENVVVTDPCIWLKAMDKLFDHLYKQCPKILKNVKFISGGAQQHGSVYWKKGSKNILQKSLKSSFYESLKDQFCCHSPIWMDQSTNEECKLLEKGVGGYRQLYGMTGSRAYERFTGMQIFKILRKEKKMLKEAERIGLVSSFAGSILIGDYAPIEMSDGSGMNLLDIRKRDWNRKCVDIICGSDKEELERVLELLGDLVESGTVVGRICPFLVQKYGMNPKTKVLAFTGDNPSSAACMLRKEGDVCISLGTSHTILGFTKEFNADFGDAQDHVFIAPIKERGFMRMTCIKNGGLVRELIRKDVSKRDGWGEFNEYLKNTKAGNGGNIGFYYQFPEIIPRTQKGSIERYNEKSERVEKFSPEIEARAIVEMQVLSLRLHSGIKNIKRLIVTGGASENEEILKILSSAFKADVYKSLDSTNSSAMGGSIRSILYDDKVPEENLKKMASPDLESSKVYESMTERFRELEMKVAKTLND